MESESSNRREEIAARLSALQEERSALLTELHLGEGYDLKELDTLFLTMPISFKGRLIQYVGRLHRKHEGKKEVRVFDFIDENLPVAMSMWRKRKSAYRKLGYGEATEALESLHHKKTGRFTMLD